MLYREHSTEMEGGGMALEQSEIAFKKRKKKELQARLRRVGNIKNGEAIVSSCGKRVAYSNKKKIQGDPCRASSKDGGQGKRCLHLCGSQLLVPFSAQLPYLRRGRADTVT